MAFTYSGTAIDTDLARVRLEIGDTVEAEALFTDEELQVFLDRESGVLLAAAAACDTLVRRFARAYDFETDGQRFMRSQMHKGYMATSIELRQRAAGVVSNATTRIDGYSDDLPYDQNTSVAGRPIIGWTDPDLPV